jgi:WD40 repeat protein
MFCTDQFDRSSELSNHADISSKLDGLTGNVDQLLRYVRLFSQKMAQEGGGNHNAAIVFNLETCVRSAGKLVSSAATLVSSRSQKGSQFGSEFGDELTDQERSQIELWIPEPTIFEETEDQSLGHSLSARPSTPPAPAALTNRKPVTDSHAETDFTTLTSPSSEYSQSSSGAIKALNELGGASANNALDNSPATTHPAPRRDSDAEIQKCNKDLIVEAQKGDVDSVRSLLASASGDRTVKIWDAKTGKCLQTLQGYGDPVTSVVFSHDSQQLASASGRTVKIWDTNMGKCLQTLKGRGLWVTSVVFSHDSQQLASASNDGIVQIWDVKTGKYLHMLPGHRDRVTSVVFSHDSQQLASASYDRTVKIWDVKMGKCLQTLKGHGHWVTSVVFSHDLQQLASASNDGIVKIWEVKTGKYPSTLPGHRDRVTSVVFSHDSQQLASASYDRTVKI